MLHRVTGLGDVGILLPVGVVITLFCWLGGHRRLALQWCILLIAGMGLTGAAKLAFHVCGDVLTGDRIRSPSGHVALSIIVYGGLAISLSGGRSRLTKALFAVGGVLLVFLIAWSRVRLGYHTRSEVLAGFLLGGVCLAAFAATYRQERLSIVSFVLVAVVLAALAYLLRQFSLTPEHHVQDLAEQIQQWLDVCR
ncbi:PAP2 superfamily protein [Hyphomicrobiales bacterium]|nr:PAP2 superfamily protein [Hyphomicrobiales bacterium]CAH1675906.1 PAP2 superfamily protein [Hyphomicrobiales bacterium]